MVDSKLLTRITTGTILGLIVLFSLLMGGLAIFLITMLFIILATRECIIIFKHKGFYPSIGVILLADAIFMMLAYMNCFDLVMFSAIMCFITAFVWILFKGRQPYIANASTTILLFIYSGLFPLYLVFIRDIGSNPTYSYLIKSTGDCIGKGLVLLLFFSVLLSDTGSYFIGTKFGKHKLSPVISPNKTVEGALGGAISAILCSMFIGYLIHINWLYSLVAGILIAFFAQVGDLCESMIKRDAGVKDSGDSLPGHGGFLDRTDSYVFTLPIMYYYFQYVVCNENAIGIIKNFLKGLW